MLGYKVPAPDEAMLVSGGRSKSNAPFRVVTGHGAFIMPFFRKARFLTLAMCEAEVSEKCVTQQGITLNVRAVIAFKVGNDAESIISAGQRFLSEQDQMSVLTGRIFAGHLRSIIGSMTVEQIIRERQKLATEVLDGSKEEMARIGLTVDALQIQSIDDDGLGYINAMSAPHNAAIQQQAQIAQAQANQLAAEAEQESQRKQAEFARETAIVKAQYKAEVDKAQAEAAQAGPLAEAEAQREVLQMRTELAQRAAELRQQELVAEVVKPAEAEAERVRILAVADAEKMKIQAEAAASHNRVALDKALIDQLPEIVEKAARGLANANVTVLNGAEGLTEVASGLVAQGRAIFDALRGTVDYYDDEDGAPPLATNSESGSTSR
ncbi:flotillin [Mycobacterium sp. 852002-53434_SCH5985345]|uniref:SPFH domain-containing protein n=1 Tax=unclassified Mycobacterium TaxID=2642494 RepID=UPI0007FB93D6|nr:MULTISPECIES: flotillin family protein [unclassified Mycobacterium]OBF54223.1 flotillin [Mycobacterium sp. 852002-53434_SCH5985345]OBF74357.1 flotillin [Mycobacterium sp. 852002-51613_SCH5001154]OBF91635.1 flotillin [Mycobacterium sp. 852014-52450_SCH5900713]